MRFLKLVAIAILLCLSVATFLVYVYPRYYILDGSRTGTDIAEEIIANKRSPAECSHVLDFDPFPSPSADEQSRLCVYIYAKLTQDPSACELLMPSDYGWSCLGAVEEKLFSGRLCTRSGALDHPVVYCNRESEGELTIDRPQIKDCSQYKRKDLREWCYDARTEVLDGAHDCQRITRDVVRDFCEYNYALKMRNPSLCSAVKDGKRRDFCTTYVSLSVKYRGSDIATP